MAPSGLSRDETELNSPHSSLLLSPSQSPSETKEGMQPFGDMPLLVLPATPQPDKNTNRDPRDKSPTEVWRWIFMAELGRTLNSWCSCPPREMTWSSGSSCWRMGRTVVIFTLNVSSNFGHQKLYSGIHAQYYCQNLFCKQPGHSNTWEPQSSTLERTLSQKRRCTPLSHDPLSL